MLKHSEELKLEIVLYIEKSRHSQGEAVRKYGISMREPEIAKFLHYLLTE